jgi:hypothetical protein
VTLFNQLNLVLVYNRGIVELGRLLVLVLMQIVVVEPGGVVLCASGVANL